MIRTKTGGVKELRTRSRFMAVAVAACFATGAQGLPTNPTVANGSASFAQTGNVLTVTNSNGAIIHWNTFSIGADETTRFIQPSVSSSVLNRVLSSDPSVLLGTLTSNGRVFLINPNGIYIGQSARIDVAQFVAGLGMTDADFLANKLKFDAPAGATGAIVNQGRITTPSGGSVLLVAPNVSNEGIITTPEGETILAAGQSVTLIDTGTPGVTVEIAGTEGQATNLGQIVAEAGRIGIAGVLVKNSGTLNASSVVKEGGRIFLRATANVETTATSSIAADGSKGGDVVLYADDSGSFAGTISARGSASAGGFVETSGRRALSVSGLRVDTQAADGSAGIWLLDPADMVIAHSSTTTGNGDFAPSGASSTIYDADINASLVTTNVVITTGAGSGGSGNVTINGYSDAGGAVNINTAAAPGPRALAINADGNVDIRYGASFSGNTTAPLTLKLTAGGNIVHAGSIYSYGAVDLLAKGAIAFGDGTNSGYIDSNGAPVMLLANWDGNTSAPAVAATANCAGSFCGISGSGSIDTNDYYYYYGLPGGSVSIKAGGDIDLSQVSIYTYGNSGYYATTLSGGAGGDIGIASTQGNLTVGYINADAGSGGSGASGTSAAPDGGVGGAGGAGGHISFSTPGTLTLTSSIYARGGYGGYGGSGYYYYDSATSSYLYTGNGGNGGAGGMGGSVSATASVIVGADYYGTNVSGGSGGSASYGLGSTTGGAGGNAGSIDFTATTTLTTGNLTASGGNGGSGASGVANAPNAGAGGAGGSGGTIALTTPGTLTLTDSLYANGGNGGGGASGYNYYDYGISSYVYTGTGGNGGAGGNAGTFAYNGASSLVLAGTTLSFQGGEGGAGSNYGTAMGVKGAAGIGAPIVLGMTGDIAITGYNYIYAPQFRLLAGRSIAFGDATTSYGYLYTANGAPVTLVANWDGNTTTPGLAATANCAGSFCGISGDGGIDTNDYYYYYGLPGGSVDIKAAGDIDLSQVSIYTYGNSGYYADTLAGGAAGDVNVASTQGNLTVGYIDTSGGSGGGGASGTSGSPDGGTGGVGGKGGNITLSTPGTLTLTGEINAPGGSGGSGGSGYSYYDYGISSYVYTGIGGNGGAGGNAGSVTTNSTALVLAGAEFYLRGGSGGSGSSYGTSGGNAGAAGAASPILLSTAGDIVIAGYTYAFGSRFDLLAGKSIAFGDATTSYGYLYTANDAPVTLVANWDGNTTTPGVAATANCAGSFCGISGSGSIDTSDYYYYYGLPGGSVSIKAAGDIDLSQISIYADGNYGYYATSLAGGAGGDVNIASTQGNLSVGYIDADGGSGGSGVSGTLAAPDGGMGGTGGTGGNVTLTTPGTLTFTGSIYARGGDGGYGGYSYYDYTSSAYTGAGGNGGTGGNAGMLTTSSASIVLATAELYLQGGDAGSGSSYGTTPGVDGVAGLGGPILLATSGAITLRSSNLAFGSAVSLLAGQNIAFGDATTSSGYLYTASGAPVTLVANWDGNTTTPGVATTANCAGSFCGISGSGSIDASDYYYYYGLPGGNVSIEAAGDLDLSQISIYAEGNSGYYATSLGGGAGGNVNIASTQGNLTVGYIDADGGYGGSGVSGTSAAPDGGMGGTGGTGGNIQLSTPGTLTFTGSIYARGGDGGYGGSGYYYWDSATSSYIYTGVGGNGGTGGNAGTLTSDSSALVLASADFYLQGGYAGSGSSSGTATGVDGNAGIGGPILLATSGAITLTSSNYVFGSAVSLLAGQNIAFGDATTSSGYLYTANGAPVTLVANWDGNTTTPGVAATANCAGSFCGISGSGSIDTSDYYYYYGLPGGSVSIKAAGDIDLSQISIYTYGNSGYYATSLVGGAGGDVDIASTQGNLTVGYIDAEGGYGGSGFYGTSGSPNGGTGGIGGAGGNVTLTTPGTLTFTSGVYANGGSGGWGGNGYYNAAYLGTGGDGGAGGAGGSVTASAASVNAASASIDIAGGSGGTGGVGTAAGSPGASGTSGRWLVYSTHPDNDSVAGLDYDFKQYGATYGVSTVQGGGNGLLYSFAPTLAVTLNESGTVTKPYDGTTNAPAGFSPTIVSVSGFVGSDTGSLTLGAVAFNDAHAATANSLVFGLSLGPITDGSGKPVYGYPTLATVSSISASITPVPLTVSLTNTGMTKVYDGATAASFTPSFSVAGLIGGDTSASLTATSLDFNSAHVSGADRVVASGISLSGITGSNGSLASDYTLGGVTSLSSAAGSASITPSVLTVNGIWSAPTSWIGNLLPENGDVAGVLIASGTSATFDGLGGPTSIPYLSSQGGFTMSGGALSVAGAFSTEDYAQTNGTVTAGSATIASSGAITQTGGGIVTPSLKTSSVGGTTLNGDNSIGSFEASNSGGAISLINSGALTIVGITNSGGNVSITVSDAASITLNHSSIVAEGSDADVTITLNGANLALSDGSEIKAGDDVTLNLPGSTAQVSLSGGGDFGPSRIWSDAALTTAATTHVNLPDRSSGGIVIDGVETMTTVEGGSGFFATSGKVPATSGSGLKIVYSTGVFEDVGEVASTVIDQISAEITDTTSTAGPTEPVAAPEPEPQPAAEPEQTASSGEEEQKEEEKKDEGGAEEGKGKDEEQKPSKVGQCV